jgi:hypothetical protein
LTPRGVEVRASGLQVNEKENGMVHVSEKAEEILKEYFKEKEITPIRIFLQTGG